MEVNEMLTGSETAETRSRRTAERQSMSRVSRTPRSAAVAGIAFSLLFMLALVLVHSAIPKDPNDAGLWLTDESRREIVLIAFGLVPFAGIAFLWFIGVVRDRVGDAEDRFFATVFLGSGLLFVALLFVTAAVAAGLVASAGDNTSIFRSSDAWEIGRRATYQLMTVYAMRMAAVFTIATSTILRRAGLAPRWLVVTGYATGFVLLVTLAFGTWIELLFPIWVLVLSVYVLIAGSRSRSVSRGAARELGAS
jgi:hypothetical protein